MKTLENCASLWRALIGSLLLLAATPIGAFRVVPSDKPNEYLKWGSSHPCRRSSWAPASPSPRGPLPHLVSLVVPASHPCSERRGSWRRIWRWSCGRETCSAPEKVTRSSAASSFRLNWAGGQPAAAAAPSSFCPSRASVSACELLGVCQRSWSPRLVEGRLYYRSELLHR